MSFHYSAVGPAVSDRSESYNGKHPKIQIKVMSHVLHIWAFTLRFLSFREGFSKIERRFQICHGFFEMFRPAYVNALGGKNRPGTTLHKETRTRIIDRYLTGEGLTAISTAARATPGTVYCIIRHHEMFGTCEAFSQGVEIILLNFHATFLNLLNCSN